MAAFRAGLFNFSKGELGPQLLGRIDVAAYNAGLLQARNVVVLKYGGVSRRMGSRVVYELREPEGGWEDAQAGQRLIPCEVSLDQAYALVFTQAKMRVATGGGIVVEAPLTVEAATNADPIEITASFHGLSDGDEVFFSEVEGMVELNGRVELVTVTSDDTFTIALDGTDFGVFTGDEGGTINVGPPPAPPAPPVVDPPLDPPDPPIIVPPYGGGGWNLSEGGVLP